VNEAEKVASAYRALLSTSLAAYSIDPSERATPPIISGTYTCGTEGRYEIRVFSSSAKSGFSFYLTGLEASTFVGSTGQPTPLGTCGLQIIFDSSSVYPNSEWIVEIPNTRAATYTTNRNAHTIAVSQASAAITLAEQELALAQATAIQSNAPARSEALARADAAVITAEAKLARVDAQIAERTLRAPFAGTITNIDILPGETVASAPVATLLATSAFEVTARIPEIDMGKLRVGQKVLMQFDAKDDEYVVGEIDFISLNATTIDGVAYFEARITLEKPPVWMRSGLNADVEIVVAEATDVLRIPKRFLTSDGGSPAVRAIIGTEVATTTVVVELEGNDGYVAISGVREGDTLVAP
jgi:HlyD family secretion protein